MLALGWGSRNVSFVSAHRRWTQNETLLALFNDAVSEYGAIEHTLLKDVTKITLKSVP